MSNMLRIQIVRQGGRLQRRFSEGQIDARGQGLRKPTRPPGAHPCSTTDRALLSHSVAPAVLHSCQQLLRHSNHPTSVSQ